VSIAVTVRDSQPKEDGMPKINDEKNLKEVGAAVAADEDEDAREFEALVRDIAQLQDEDTIVEHMDLETYRRGKRT
jgi:hypothetical protein